MRTIAILSAIALLAAPSLAHAQDLDPATAAKIAQAASIGKDINDHDQSAWHVTDELMSLVSKNPELRTKKIGYITERVDPTHVKTIFLLSEGDTTRLFFTGVTEGSRIVSTENFITDAGAPLATPEQVARMKAATMVNAAMNRQICNKPLNTVIMPVPDDPGALYVYALASETSTDVVQLGGHVRLTIGADGAPKGEVKRYSNSCISMDKGRNAAMLMVTLPPELGDTPTEMHVFKSLSHQITILVMAGEKLWQVSGASIILMDAPPKPN